jgi:hypothetical protein
MMKLISSRWSLEFSAESGDRISVEEASVISEYNRRQACNVLESMQSNNLAFFCAHASTHCGVLCW